MRFKQVLIDKLTHEMATLKRLKFSAASEAYTGEWQQLLFETIETDLEALSAEIEKLDYQLGGFTVERHVRGKWVCGQCETLVQAPVSAHIIDKGIPTAGLLAQVVAKTVPSSGLRSPDSALYRLSRDRPASRVICDMLLSRATPPRPAANALGYTPSPTGFTSPKFLSPMFLSRARGL